jgi:hypothetical protein
MALVATTVAMIGGTLLSILHLNSNQLSEMANAGSPRDMRLAATVTTQDKSCAEQSWPFIEGRCLIDTRSLKKAERAQPRQATVRRLSELQDAALASRRDRARAKSPDGVRTVAKRSLQTAASTTGAAPRGAETNGAAKAADGGSATSPDTASIATAPSATRAASPTPPKTDNAIAARRLQDRQRREARHRERLTREQREARAEWRSRQDEQSSVGRWNGHASSSYSGVLQRGPFDGLFSTIR